MKSGSDEHHQLLKVFRRPTGQVLADLCPNILDRIEFRRAGREVVHVQSRVLRKECLHRVTLMNRGFVPDQNDWTVHLSKQMSQEVNDLFAGQVAAIRLGTQFDPAATWCDEQRTDRIDTLVVLNAGPNSSV
jgi:hypothetical protein